MLYNFSIKNTFALFFLTIGIFTFCFTHQTYAYLLPTVSVNTLKITSSDNNQIKGEFTAQNRENYYMGNLNYEIQLLSGTSLDKLSLVTTNVSVDKFFINPMEHLQNHLFIIIQKILIQENIPYLCAF